MSVNKYASIFSPQMETTVCVRYPSNIFVTRALFNLGIPQFLLGRIQSCNAFRPVACEGKYLMDYKARFISLFDRAPL